MSTRGFVGFVTGGTEKIAYNHSDSYPDWLGMNVLRWLRKESAKLPDGFVWARERAAALRAIDPEGEPTDEDFEALKEFYNPNVGGRSARPTWYQLLRETQGSPGAMLRAGVIEDAGQFPLNSLFAEWGYIVDFDTDRFEVYRGFQKEPHDKGRFAGRGSKRNVAGEYFPCALVASWPLHSLPSDDDFLAALGYGESE